MKKVTSMLLAIVLVIMQIPAMTYAATDNPFKDVKESAYYYEPIMWAVEKGITSGTSGTTFSPEDTCTRGQVVTFLWRAAGKPEPESIKNPFTDVKDSAYYYDAVLWAVENGVTSGVSSTKFGPDEACTRGQVVTFQWRSSGKPAPSADDNPFKDVKDSAYYYDAVLWAVENSITSGTSATTFSPEDTCTRGQIVTFLSRQFNKGKTEAEKYFEENAEILDVTPVEESEDVQTEAQADAALESRGFEEIDVMTEYDMAGDFLEEEKVVSDASSEEHPMYYSYYKTENNNVWTIIITGDRVIAYPVSYNVESGNDVITVVSEEDSIINYDVIDNMYYEIIPNDDTMIVKTVKEINTDTLEKLSQGELQVDVSETDDISINAETTPATQYTGCVSNGGTKDGPVVVSMGDSYSSGEGNPDFIGWTGDLKTSVQNKEFLAHRSKNSWSSQLEIDNIKMKDNKNWYFAAVSGAETKDMAGWQKKKIEYVDFPDKLSAEDQFLSPQTLEKKYTISKTEELDPQYSILDTLRSEGKNVEYVTLTLGGNDVDFVGIVTKLVSGIYDGEISFGSLESKLESKKQYFEYILRYDLKNVYNTIASKTDYNANIIVAGYPRLFDESGKGPAGITKKRVQMLNDTVSYFNDRIEELVEEVAMEGIKISFVSVEGRENHSGFWFCGAYSNQPAINKIYVGVKKQDINQNSMTSSYSMHPNSLGLLYYSSNVQTEINRIEENRDDSEITGNIGQYITFGSYEQDGNLENGKEPIEWLILDKKDGKTLVISRYALDCKRYREKWEPITWETSTLRKWLNNDFYNEAFGGKGVLLSVVKNLDTYWGYDSYGENRHWLHNCTGEGIVDLVYHGYGGNDTQDRIFLLSLEEAETYFTADEDRKCVPTPYAVRMGGHQYGGFDPQYMINGEGACRWLLRSPGYDNYILASVGCSGNPDYTEFGTDCVRPAMWINMPS